MGESGEFLMGVLLTGGITWIVCGSTRCPSPLLIGTGSVMMGLGIVGVGVGSYLHYKSLLVSEDHPLK
jgi:hypothetical protein